MDISVTSSVKSISSTLHRLLLHPSEASLDGEVAYDDDEWRFREKGLDIQDFAPSYIDVHQYASKREGHETDNQKATFQVFVYSFSYIPDPTWLVNWESGTGMEEWSEAGMVRLNERFKRQHLFL